MITFNWKALGTIVPPATIPNQYKLDLPFFFLFSCLVIFHRCVQTSELSTISNSVHTNYLHSADVFCELWWKNDYALDLNGENELKKRKRAQLIYTLDRYLLSHSTWCRKSPLLYLCFVFHLRMIFFSFKMLFYKQKPKCVKVLINIFEFFSFNKMFLFRRWLLNKDVSLIFTRQRNKDEPVICEQ